MTEIHLERAGAHLSCRDFGGSGMPLLLLHGLAGHAGEWSATAERLASGYHVVALDQRGHGDSERVPGDVSREAFVADVAAVIDTLGLGSVVLVGQSMGANTAMLVAAEHPALVRALVVAEGSPDGPQGYVPRPDVAVRIENWLARWPVPFADVGAAHAFFRDEGLEPTAWAAGLRPRGDGLWPAFEPRVIVECIAELASRGYWQQWRAIQCPTLIVFGQHGYYTPEHANELAAQNPHAIHMTIPDAGHDVHLDAPDSWAEALQAFLAQLR
jgi:pimeloyl-ACP methyl ester carboxylesterase